MEIHHVHESGTHTPTIYTNHTHSLLNTQDNTDVTVDEDISCSSVRYTYTPHTHTSYTLFLIPKIIPTSQPMEIHHVHQLGTHTYNLFLILKIKQTPRQMEIHHVHQSGTHTYTLFLLVEIKQTPRQMEIHHVHQSSTQTHTISV